MDPQPDLVCLPNLLLAEAEVSSDPGLDPRLSGRSQASKLGMCRSRCEIQREALSKLTRKESRYDGAMSITKTLARTTPSLGQGEIFDSPLRLALARRSVRSQIFACMDKGDKKTEIESRTGLSHRCIKWHRRMWRKESDHPSLRSRELSNSSTRTPLSPSTRNERAFRKRQACDEKDDSSVAGESSRNKRRRKHRVVKQSKGRSMRTGLELSGSGGRDCAERGTRGSGLVSEKKISRGGIRGCLCLAN